MNGLPSESVAEIDEVIRINTIIGHVLTSDSRRDQGTPGRFHTSHAERQLIAYLSTGMYSCHETEFLERLEDLVTRVEERFMDRSYSSALIRQLYDLERVKEELDLELFRGRLSS